MKYLLVKTAAGVSIILLTTGIARRFPSLADFKKGPPLRMVLSGSMAAWLAGAFIHQYFLRYAITLGEEGTDPSKHRIFPATKYSLSRSPKYIVCPIGILA